MAASKLSTLVKIASSLRPRLSTSFEIFSQKFFDIWWSSHKKSTLFWRLFPYLVAASPTCSMSAWSRYCSMIDFSFWSSLFTAEISPFSLRFSFCRFLTWLILVYDIRHWYVLSFKPTCAERPPIWPIRLAYAPVPSGPSKVHASV